MRVRTILAGVLFLFALVRADGAAQAPETPVTGDWLLMHALSDPEQLNPLTASDEGASEVLTGNVFEFLLNLDPRTLELKPVIAESRPAISPDKLTYTFKIRRDVRFQDGRPVTGEDVLFSMKAVKCPLVDAPFLRVYYESLVDAELLDSYTIRLTTKEPYFLNELVLGETVIMPRHYYDPQDLLKSVALRDLTKDPAKLPDTVKRFADAFNKNYNRNPLGSGPYKFSRWKTGQEVELVRDPNYWGNGKPGIDQSYIDRVKFRIINNTDAALVTLKSGGLDLIKRLDPIQHIRGTSSERFKREFQKLEFYEPSYTYLGWNNVHPIFKDKRVRQAMSYFVDRQQMIKTILFGLGQIVDGPVFPFRPEYDKTLYSYPFDPKKGEALLKQAGWKDTDGDGVLDKVIDGKKVPFRFEIKFNSGNVVRQSIALILQDELKKHGIVATIRALDWTIFLDDTKNHKFDMQISGWLMPPQEPDDFQIFHSSQADNKGSNNGSYKNPRVDKILEEHRREFDEKKRIALYHEFQKILNEDQPYTFLFARKSVAAVQRRFRGVEVLPVGLAPNEWWVPRALQRYGTRAAAS